MHFHREIDNLKQKILELGGLVEDRVRKACSILESRDPDMAHGLVNSDWEVDEMEILVEEECLKILALHQPVARDLRLVVAIIKINNELERMADMTVNIAKRVLNIEQEFNHSAFLDYQPMGERVLEMVKMSLDALVTEDAELARRIFLKDEEVDRMRNRAYGTVLSELNRGGEHAADLVNLYLIARHLERIADRATNIAEEVVYLVEGEIVRSSGELSDP
ncbi:phosphate signaling complex protein PhoU [Desulfogranum mediterraneum]|uniref:phosphate signaling complex protein PhoU n=1 Tax=Desulfogranum mediterraneum TaxID=160661 RepID=UPI000428F268|nr:phosphate signaling complex protein PhoU [Desulfogranum mediterraneum]